jgi:inner membrane transporter RhtA
VRLHLECQTAVGLLPTGQRRRPLSRSAGKDLAPHLWFAVNALFHYIGPSFAVLLFPMIGALGVAWLRIASAAVTLGPIARPWRLLAEADWRERWLLVFFGAALGAMNCSFYLAIGRLPISLVVAIEFIGPLAIAFAGSRCLRNLVALCLALAGVYLVLGIRGTHDLIGLLWAALNAGFFVAYILLGHRIARHGAARGVSRLGTAMLIACLVTAPLGLGPTLRILGHPRLLLAGLGVGFASSVVPYICDQLVMARVSRGHFALLLSILPASAAIMGAIVLHQLPSAAQNFGIALVMGAVALHRSSDAQVVVA